MTDYVSKHAARAAGANPAWWVAAAVLVWLVAGVLGVLLALTLRTPTAQFVPGTGVVTIPAPCPNGGAWCPSTSPPST